MSVTGTVNPTTFEWIIPNFREWFESGCNGNLCSPDLDQQDSSWYLCLYPFGEEWISVSLCRSDSGAPKTITYTIKIKCRTDVAEITKTKHFREKYDFDETKNLLKKEDIQNSIVLDSFTVICCITCGTTHPVAGKKFLTSAVQTEDQNSVIEKEKPKDDDWSSLDLKGVAVLTERMKNLLIKGGDHDVTICVQDKEFRAHRNILSARSPVFAMMLAHDSKEKNTGTINIEDCDPESFDEFLLYVYSGRTENLTPSNALQLYYPADKYDFPVLKEQCVNILKSSLSVESICDVVLLAAKHQEKELLDVAAEFFARNMKEILVTVGWQKFMPQNPVEANELLIKSTKILHP